MKGKNMKKILSKIGLWYIDLKENIKDFFENIKDTIEFMDEYDIMNTILLVFIGVFMLLVVFVVLPDFIQTNY